MNGYDILVRNDTSEELNGTLSVSVLQHGRTEIASESESITIEPRSKSELPADRVIGRFLDVSYRYRFGPEKHDVVVASITNKDGLVILNASKKTSNRPLLINENVALTVNLFEIDGATIMQLTSDRFLKNVHIQAKELDILDNYFDLTPDTQKNVFLNQSTVPRQVTVSASNLANPVRVRTNE